MNNINDLKDIVVKLRSKEGCPWDAAQTHASLKSTCIEEASEVICGINIFEDTGDPDNLKEELGDLLLQVMFHSVIAEEEGLFTFEDVVETVSEKMIRRHPHVFSGVVFASDEERHKAWEEIKSKEKAGKEWQTEYLKKAMDESLTLIDKAKERKGYV
ncbi:MAG: nucleotide pyrophosphohydrolase [Lachnospiraceae bacterium]|nr:nucleotide pyrophosphohydrolase [Lachnospiraceae bacterium]